MAGAYRYPLAFCTLPDGRTGLVHCPEEYNRRALADPAGLDTYGDVFAQPGVLRAEVAGACLVDEDVIVSTSWDPNSGGWTRENTP